MVDDKTIDIMREWFKTQSVKDTMVRGKIGPYPMNQPPKFNIGDKVKIRDEYKNSNLFKDFIKDINEFEIIVSLSRDSNNNLVYSPSEEYNYSDSLCKHLNSRKTSYESLVTSTNTIYVISLINNTDIYHNISEHYLERVNLNDERKPCICARMDVINYGCKCGGI